MTIFQRKTLQPLQRVREELKSYANRHKILELGEPAREVLKSYDILEEVEEFSQVAQSCPQQGKEGTKCSDEVSNCSSRSGNPQPKSAKSAILGVAATTKDSSRNGDAAARSRAPHNRNRPVTDANRNAPKSQKQQKIDSSDIKKPELKATTLKKPPPETGNIITPC